MAEPNFFNFSDFLEEQPQALYQSFLGDPKNNMNSSMKRYYQNQFSNIQNEYLGKLARDMRGGITPTGKFADYLEKDVFTQPQSTVPSSDMNYRPASTSSPMGRFTGYDRYRKESPYLRNQYGSGPSSANAFAPSARWITY
jgi:hypothetical protein|tara:strand:- start:221 stop:643 length:423 start_codon:yes stop_codon:yes gene_type:complete